MNTRIRTDRWTTLPFWSPILLAAALLLSAAPGITEANGFDGDDGRPDILAEATRYSWGPGKYSPSYIQRRSEIIMGVLKAFAQSIPDRQIYLLGRDMDDVYDAFRVVCETHSQFRPLAPFVHRLLLSRPIVKGSTLQQITTWSLRNQLDLLKVLEGKEKVMIIDIGWHGSIFKALLGHWQEMARQEGLGPEYIGKLVRDGAQMFLLGPWVPSKFDSIVARFESNHSALLRAFQAEDFAFPGLFDRYPDIKHELFDYTPSIVDVREQISRYVKKYDAQFAGSGISLSHDGSRITSLNTWKTDRDAQINQEEHRRRQQDIYAFFSSRSAADELEPYLNRALSALQKPIRYPSKDKTPLAVGQDLEQQLRSSREHEPVGIKSLVYKGTRADIYLAEGQTGLQYAVKVAKGTDPRMLDSLERTGRRLKKLKELGVPHSETAAQTAGYILKQWIEGTTAKAWLEEVRTRDQEISPADENAPYESKDFVSEYDSTLFGSLVTWIKKLISEGIFIERLTPSNLVWDGSKWKVIDSGSIKQMSPIEAALAYQETLTKYWRISKECSLAFTKEAQ